jgi:hypothetical protein
MEKLQSQKTDTLNERKAWDEKEKLDVENKAREKEIASRQLPKETIYEITLADAGNPGLPPPVQLETENEATNSVAASVPAQPLQASSPTAPELVSTPKVWEPDPMLDESERILANYISLWSSHETLIAKHQ